MRRMLFGVIAGLALVAVQPEANAFRYRTCEGVPLKMSSAGQTLRSSDVSFPAGYWLDGLNDAVAKFNENPGLNYYSRVSDTDGLGLGNGQNEVWGSTDQAILQGAPAIAYSYWNCYYILWVLVANMTEGDVIFDYTNTTTNPFEWTATGQKSALFSYTGSGRLLQGTAIHEFGHAFGLLHVNTEYNVMGADFTHLHANAAAVRAYVGEDAGSGMVFLYGVWSGGPEDLGVVHWRYDSASGEYSWHRRTQIFDSVGNLLPAATVAGEAGFEVRRGQVIQAEFTYENNGRSTQTNVPAYYYISSNNFITTGDRYIGSATFGSLARGDVLTWRKRLVIPSNLGLNRNYWLGVVLNPNNTPAEGRRSNNATYIPIRVVP